MWSSIQQILTPQSLDEAQKNLILPYSRILGGGSYLVGEQDPAITTLVDVARLVDHSISTDKDIIRVGAGVSLQDFTQHFQEGAYQSLAAAAKYSCFSKNIRNQRQIGGEVAQGRLNSELVVLLDALGAQVEVSGSVPGAWTGEGIISSLLIERSPAENCLIERFALLQSAPAFLIVAAARTDEQISISVGGNVTHLIHASLALEPAPEAKEQLLNFIQPGLISDHTGSQDYKTQLVFQALARIEEALCK